MQDKRRIRTWVKRFEEDDKYTRTHNHQGAGEVRHPRSTGSPSIGRVCLIDPSADRRFLVLLGRAASASSHRRHGLDPVLQPRVWQVASPQQAARRQRLRGPAAQGHGQPPGAGALLTTSPSKTLYTLSLLLLLPAMPPTHLFLTPFLPLGAPLVAAVVLLDEHVGPRQGQLCVPPGGHARAAALLVP